MATRGKTKAESNWRYTGPVSTIVLELDVLDSKTRDRVEKMFWNNYNLQRAIRVSARKRVKAWKRAKTEKAAAAAVLDKQDKQLAYNNIRTRLGLTKKDFEKAAAKHVDNAKHLRHYSTKALAQNLADSVWEDTERSLFPDSSGKFFGTPKIGKYKNFKTIPGRARSHTKETPSWESFRLVGTLEGHREAYPPTTRPGHQNGQTSALTQPGALKPTAYKVPWHKYTGPLQVEFTGLNGGILVLPVRLEQGPGRQERLEYYLSDKNSWHKIDLVRVPDASVYGGWRYYAHLLVLKAAYESGSDKTRRANVPLDRRAGVDVNVSNISVASFDTNLDVKTSVDKVDESTLFKAKKEALKLKRKQKALERSRRSTNTGQYKTGKRQQKRDARREEKGLAPKQTQNPKGARKANKRGVPKSAYKKDTLSNASYQLSKEIAVKSGSVSKAKKARARDVAKQVVTLHGPNIITEHVSIATWMGRWGKRIALFSPGQLRDAIGTEAVRCGGSLEKASTYNTALSQHCLCGHKQKKTLSQRTHKCQECGLTADRDVLSALLAACVDVEPGDPGTATLNKDLASSLLKVLWAQQEGSVKSTCSAKAEDAQVSERHGRTGSGDAQHFHLCLANNGCTECPECATAQSRAHNMANPLDIKHSGSSTCVCESAETVESLPRQVEGNLLFQRGSPKSGEFRSNS